MTRLTARQRGYDSRWEKARRSFLASHPYCVKCAERGTVTQATVVDHIVKHNQNWSVFWDKSNWQPLCAPHHNSLKQREDNRGYVIGCDVAGRPIDPSHPWNKAKSTE